MTRLWRALEDAASLMEVAEVWQQRLGTEFEPLSHPPDFPQLEKSVGGRWPQ